MPHDGTGAASSVQRAPKLAAAAVRPVAGEERLPGNPVAAFVGLLSFGRTVLACRLGASAPPLCSMLVRAGFALARQPGRDDFFPDRLLPGADGPIAERIGRGGLARLRPLIAADGLGRIDGATPAVAPGDPLEFLPFTIPVAF